jgi:hypothetical protein
MHIVRWILAGALLIIAMLAAVYYTQHSPNSGGTAATTTTDGSGGGIAPFTSGVSGIVLLGPICPVQQMPPDPSCADKPYQAAVSVYREGSTKPFVNQRSAVDGRFGFALPPGTYTLKTETGTTLPRCASVTVVVPAEGYATTTVYCDTGIR